MFIGWNEKLEKNEWRKNSFCIYVPAMLFWYRLGVISGSGKCSSITALNVVKYSKIFSILQFINLFGHFGMFILTFLHIDGTMNSSRANRYDSSTKMLSNQQNPTPLAEAHPYDAGLGRMQQT